jgi:hypothetical protein
LNQKGNKKIFSYILTEQYSSGCDAHPELEEHQLIVTQLEEYKKINELISEIRTEFLYNPVI